MTEYRFECTLCGQCCRQPGDLFFESDDVRLAAEGLNMSPGEFIDKYLAPDYDGTLLLSVPQNSACPFLVDSKCSIEEFKPKQCRQYPFWDEMLDAKAWKEEAEHCEGIGRGEPWSPADIAAYRNR